jgi:predicted phosphodiesterase
MAARCVIAHLSDIHIGNQDAVVLEQLEDSLLQPPRPDFVVATGDLSEHSRVSELQQARAFLERVVGRLRESGPARYLVVPGNHDVGYLKWHRNWRRVFPSWSDGAIQGVCQPRNVNAADERYCECYPTAGLVFLKFDSNRLPGNLLNYANGTVGMGQFTRIKQALQRHREADPDHFDEYRKIALVHHHVHYLPMKESDQLFLMTDAGLFWRLMVEWGVELILHGHKHYATHAIIRYLRPRDGQERAEREVMVLSAGSASSRDRPSNQGNSYYKIECDAFKSKVLHFGAGDVGFRPAEPPIAYRHLPRFHIPDIEAAVDMTALESILVPEDADLDRHRYTRLSWEATIGSDLSYTSRVTFEGIYHAATPHLNVPVVVVGAPGRWESIRVSAHDCLRDQPLPSPKVTPHAGNVDKVYVRFSLPTLHDGERFRVRLEGTIPNLMYRRNDYDAVGLARFTGVLEQFDYVLRSELQPVEPRCFALHRSGPRRLEIDFQEGRLDGGSVRYVIRPRIPSVADLGLGLLLHYHELLPG